MYFIYLDTCISKGAITPLHRALTPNISVHLKAMTFHSVQYFFLIHLDIHGGVIVSVGQKRPITCSNEQRKWQKCAAAIWGSICGGVELEIYWIRTPASFAVVISHIQTHIYFHLVCVPRSHLSCFSCNRCELASAYPSPEGGAGGAPEAAWQQLKRPKRGTTPV